MDLDRKSKTLQFLTQLLNLHTKHLKICKNKEDYYALFTATQVFKKFTETQFKEDFAKYESGDYDEALALIDEDAEALAESFVKQHNKKLN